MKSADGIKKYLNSRNYYDKQYTKKLQKLIKLKRKKLSEGRKLKYFNNTFLPLIKDKFIPLFSFENYYGVKHNVKYQFKCCTCNNIFNMSIKNLKRDNSLICSTCKHSNKSNIQSLIKQELIKINANTVLQEEKLGILSGKKSLDFYFPELKLAIEYNGNIWHAEKFNNKTKLYHYSRFLDCLNKNVKYIAIWSDEYSQNKEYILTIFNYFLNNNTNTNITVNENNLHIYEEDKLPQTVNAVFFTKNDNDKFLIILNNNDIFLILKFTKDKKVIINDLYCINFFILNKYSHIIFNKIKQYFNTTLFFTFDNRLLPLYKILFTNIKYIGQRRHWVL